MLFRSNENEFELKLIPKFNNYQSLNSLDGLVGIDLNLDHELVLEGVSRDIVRLVQQSRKDNNFNITDKINIKIKTNHNLLIDAIDKFLDYIKEQTLAYNIDYELVEVSEVKTKIDNHPILINISK